MVNESTYFVVLSDPKDFDLQRMADVLVPSLSLPRVDIIMRLKNSWGMLHNTSERIEAENLQRELHQKGIDTFILPFSELKLIPQPKILKKAIPEPQGLVFAAEDQTRTLPWNNFTFMCAGQILETKSVKKRTIGDPKVARTIATTGVTLVSAVRISHHRLKGKEVTEKKTTTNYILDLIDEAKSENIRIIGETFNYSFLGERMLYNVPMNFKNLCMDVLKFMSKVKKNQGVRAMEANDMAKTKYTDMDSFENEKLWLMQLLGRIQ